MAQAKEKKRTKRPTALKRDIQSRKRQMTNRMFKSKVRTAMRSLKEAQAGGAVTPELLSSVYSLLDKGVKKGVYKINKASRLKSRLSTANAA